MAHLTGSRHLFFTTSPRTPDIMIPDINLLVDNYEGKIWNKDTQASFMTDLINSEHFNGNGPADLALAGRDRITRSPKSLGFVNLNPTIELTDAGHNLLNYNRTEEVFLRQLLKFQLPSPYHVKSNKEENIFWVKPYLEIIRLIYMLGTLTFDELMIFGLQLTHYNRFDEINNKIKEFRKAKAKNEGSYRIFRGEILTKEILEIFDSDIKAGKTKVRESDDDSIKNFVKTKSRTMRDYADACVRYIRSTGHIKVSQRGRSLSIVPEKKKNVEFILRNIPRDPVHYEDTEKYKEYLFDGNIPSLYTDNRETLLEQIRDLIPSYNQSKLEVLETIQLKDMLFEILEERKQSIIYEKTMRIKQHKEFDDIMNTYEDIRQKNLYDQPLMLEWNTWRAMTMLNGGDIKSNVNVDDEGEPMSTAPGNTADILCDYGDFGLTVEVTLQSGMRQYESEGEPVTRHLGKYKEEIGKPTYCLFIAPKINKAIISHFYVLHHVPIAYYGGKSIIIPLELSVFEEMVRASYQAKKTPTPDNVESLFKYSKEISTQVADETEWYKNVTDKALSWLD